MTSTGVTGDSTFGTELQALLEVAACLNQERIDYKLLQCAAALPSIDTLLSEAINASILLTVDEDRQQDTESCYMFSSDETRTRIYESNAKRQELHAAIADRLWKHDFDNELVVEHFIQGQDYLLKSLNNDEEQASQIATLCLEVGQTAVRASRFHDAAIYLNFGVILLEQTMKHCWRGEYDLCLRLFRAAAEANYCDSNLDQAQRCIDAVVENARSFQDTLGIQATQIYVLGAKGWRKEAIRVGLNVLEQLGEPVNANPTKIELIWRFKQISFMLRNKSNESIMRLPTMTNQTKMVAMQILCLMFSHAISSHRPLVPVLVLRLVRLTLQHGLTVMASVAFAKYAMLICNVGQYDLADNYCKLALALYERFPVPEWLPRVKLGVYAGVYSCIKDPEDTIEHLEYGARVGLETGDIEVALILAYLHANSLLSLGRPLALVEKELVGFVQDATDLNQIWLKNRLAMLLQYVRNLMGTGGNDGLKMIGNVFDQDAYNQVCSNDPLSRVSYHLHELTLYYLAGDYETALKEARLGKEIFTIAPAQHFTFALLYLVSGLTIVCRLRETNQRRNIGAIRDIRRHIRHLKERAMLSPGFCCGKVFLLQAELAWLQGKHDKARYHYTCAISLSNGLLLDSALANECAGRFLLSLGEMSKASTNFKVAHTAYSKLGIQVKIRQLDDDIKTLFSS